MNVYRTGYISPGQGKGGVGEALHAARHHHAPLAQGQLRRSQAYRFETTGAHLGSAAHAVHCIMYI